MRGHAVRGVLVVTAPFGDHLAVFVNPTPATFTASILPMRAPSAPAVRAGSSAPEALLRVHAGVSKSEVDAAVVALRQIPVADRQLLAKAGLKVDLLPSARLEGNMIGATQVEQRGTSPWAPTSIRVAAHAGVANSPTSHIVAHEVGHAIEVLRRQDRSEDAAERYVQRVLRSGPDQALTAARLRSEHGGPAASGIARLFAPAREAGAASSGVGMGMGVAAVAAAVLAALLIVL